MNSLTSQSFARRLTLLYCAALGTVALLSLLGQFLVQELISRQRDDSSIINIAGRQRMLSQRISKAALAGSRVPQADERRASMEELEQALDLWQASHEQLLHKTDSPTIREMLTDLDASRAHMLLGAKTLLAIHDGQEADSAADSALSLILASEADFLEEMDLIVSAFEREALGRVERLRRVEWVLLAITLAVLLMEALFIFRPAVGSIRRTLQRLVASEGEREQIAAQLRTIFDAVPALILYHDREGAIIRVNRFGAELMGESPESLASASVYTWFSDEARHFREEDEWIYKNGQSRRGLLHFLRNSQGDLRWLRMNKVPYYDLDQNLIGIIVFAVDVSAHKLLEKRLMELRAEEQRRLGYDLHDGLGQHLSGILYLSRGLENRLRGKDHSEHESAAEIVNLVKASVETVRNLSKGLRPLSDEPNALTHALAELARKTRDSTGIDCVFEEDGQVLVFESDVSEHLFRIAQEAINNAIRHSGCKAIRVRVKQSDDETMLEVSDDGHGLRAGATAQAAEAGGKEGLGLSIMKHRAELMGGLLTVESIPDEGATIRCSVTT